jgi:hypothetical protein
LPGYLLLAIYISFDQKKLLVKRLIPWIVSLTLFTLFFGCYAYIQNMVVYKNPIGPKELTQKMANFSNEESLIPGVVTNVSRLFGQFISCDGLPPDIASGCLSAKAVALKPILVRNVESDSYLYAEEKFTISGANLYNAEAAWYGPLSWMILLPSLFIGAILAIKKRQFAALILLGTAIMYFLSIPVIKNGWDAYQGRYLIIAIALVQPFTAWILGSGKVFRRIMTGIICAASLFIMVYSTANNASLPVLSRAGLTRLEKWGMEHSLLVQKIAYKLKPYAMYEYDVWNLSYLKIKTSAEARYYPAVGMIEDSVPQDSSLGIVDKSGMFFDYLFRGVQVRRSFLPLTDGAGLPPQNMPAFILLSPDYSDMTYNGYKLISQNEGWNLLEREQPQIKE